MEPRRTLASRSPEDAREINRLRAQNSRLNADADAHRRQLRRMRQVPVAPKAVAAPTPFELVDPRRKPQAGSKVLPPLTPPLQLARQMGAALVAELRAMTIDVRALDRKSVV